MHDDAHLENTHHPEINYLAIFIALCACTGLSVVADMLGEWGLFEGQRGKRVVALMVLAIAVAKAQYVMRYFMHLKFEGLWKYVLLLPTAILACGLPIALAPDIALHYYTPEHPSMQSTFVVEEDGHAGPGASEAPAAGGHHH